MIFRDYAGLALDQTRETTISAELEQRLVSHGVAALGLSNVYARHLLQEVADEKGRSLAKETAGDRGVSSTSPEQVDPQLQAFLNDIEPILAEHRGINAKSRVLLSSRARERGLSDEQMDQALALLQRQRDDGEETLQRERLAAFRQYVMAFVSKLPQAILTANVEQTLTEQGRLAYGVPPDRARAVIREEARARNVAVISQERAEQHIRRLVEEWIGEEGHLDRPAHDRVEAEGRQWGLSDEVIEVDYSRVVANSHSAAIVGTASHRHGFGSRQSGRAVRDRILQLGAAREPSASPWRSRGPPKPSTRERRPLCHRTRTMRGGMRGSPLPWPRPGSKCRSC